MKLTVWGLFLLMLATYSDAGMLRQKTTYQVTEVTRVISPLEFECKLKDYPYARSARFKVQIQNLKLLDESSTDRKAISFLQDFFDQAQSIQLTNVKSRNYFRLSADVLVDERDLAQIYVDNQLAALIQTPKEDKTDSSKAWQLLSAKPTTRRPAGSARKPFSSGPVASLTDIPSRANRQIITIEDLLNAQVDLSMITDETPLVEALDIMARSVRPNLPLVVLWNDLETNALIDRDTPIGVSGFGQMRLGFALTAVLDSVSTPQSDLVLVSRDRIMMLGTKQGVNYKPTTRVYTITDLTALPSYANEFNGNFGSSQGGSSSGRSSRNSGSGSTNRY